MKDYLKRRPVSSFLSKTDSLRYDTLNAEELETLLEAKYKVNIPIEYKSEVDRFQRSPKNKRKRELIEKENINFVILWYEIINRLTFEDKRLPNVAFFDKMFSVMANMLPLYTLERLHARLTITLENRQNEVRRKLRDVKLEREKKTLSKIAGRHGE